MWCEDQKLALPGDLRLTVARLHVALSRAVLGAADIARTAATALGIGRATPIPAATTASVVITPVGSTRPEGRSASLRTAGATTAAIASLAGSATTITAIPVIWATTVAATASATNNNPVVPGGAAHADVGTTAAAGAILTASPAAIPTARTCRLALASDIDMHYLARLHTDFALGVTSLATIILRTATTAVGTAALRSPDFEGQLGHAQRHLKGLGTACVRKEL